MVRISGPKSSGVLDVKDQVSPVQAREWRRTHDSRDRQGAAALLFPDSRLLDVAQNASGLAVDALRLVEEGLTLGRVVSGGHEVALEDPDFVTLLFPTAGRIAMWTAKSEHDIDSRSLAMVLAEKRRTRVIPAKNGVFVAATVLFPRSRLQALDISVSGSSRKGTDQAAWTISTAFGRGFGQLLSALADDVFRQPDRLLTARARGEFVSLVDDLLVGGAGSAVTGPRLGGGLREFQRVSRACDIIEARAEEALSIATLAEELGVTPRSLQLSFQAVHGVSPRQYLQRVRLDRVRARILAQGDSISVTTAALDCGFMHLGRFSQSYRRTFGELPSETQSRRRQAHGRFVSHSG